LGLVLSSSRVYFFVSKITGLAKERYMTKKLFTLLIASVFVLVLSLPIFAQEGSQKEESKETPAQENAENEHKGKGAKQARWEGMVTRSNKDQSTLTVRKVGSIERTIHYDASTQFTSQEHGSKKINNIDATEIKDNDRVICLGNYDDKGEFYATQISKRLTNPLIR